MAPEFLPNTALLDAALTMLKSGVSVAHQSGSIGQRPLRELGQVEANGICVQLRCQ